MVGKKSKQCNFKLTEEEFNALETEAEQKEVSRSAFIRMCVCKELGISADKAYLSHSYSQVKPGDKQELQFNSAVIDALRTQIQVLEKFVLRLDRDLSKVASHQRNDSQTDSMADKSPERIIIESRNHLHEQSQKSDEELILDSALNDESVSIDGAGFIRKSADLAADNLSPLSDAETARPHTPVSKFQNRMTQAQEAKLIALVKSAPPVPKNAWSYRLLAEEMQKRGYVAAMSHETARRVLKDHNIDLKALTKENDK